MKKYDVIIVGSGPAGITAARILSEANINFCIIEKNKFPREKLCGGGLTQKSITLLNKLNLNLEGINTKKCKKVEFFATNLKKEITLTNNIVMVDRIEFDYNNMKQVNKNKIFESEKIINIENNILITDKDKYEFKYIIFADGANGYSKKLITNRKFGFCVEFNCETTTNKIILDFCAIEDGYGWVFPKANHTTIGLGKFNDKKVDYQNLLCDFAKKHNFKIDKSKIRGYHIPVYSKEVFKKSVIEDKYILVGDAASLVDQVSGEGIYYALASGVASAESIISCLQNNCNLKKTYFKRTKNMFNDLNRRNILSRLLYSKYGTIFIRIGLSNKYFVKYLNKLFG